MTGPTAAHRLAGSWATLVLSFVLCYGTAMVGGYFTSMSVGGWYRTLQLPAWTPSGAVIGAVWNVLFGLMAIAAWLAWRQQGMRQAPLAFSLFALQLVLNATWSALFFGWRSPGWAAIEIWLLWLTIIATAVLFWRISRWAGLLLVPYIGWVAFAGVLNAAIWWMNR
jgi:tryptophan-rich sensory protein